MLTISVIANYHLEQQYSCSGAWVWLIIILVTVSCTDLFLYFLHQFSNSIQLVHVLLHLFNSVPFKIFWKIFMSSLSSLMSLLEQATESTLLKQRQLLISSGQATATAIKIRGSHLIVNNKVHGEVIDSVYKTAIKIRGSRLIVNNRVHGEVIDSVYTLHPLLPDHIHSVPVVFSLDSPLDPVSS